MRTIKLFLLLSICMVPGLKAQNLTQSDYHLLIGTYATDENINGIHVYEFNSDNGKVKRKQPVTELANASYLAISQDKKNVYAVSGNKVNAYTFNSGSGVLTFMNNVPTQGSCYVSVDSSKKVVFVGNYGGGNALAIHLNTDGSFVENTVQAVQHKGNSINKDRQESPHVHSVVLSPDEYFLLVPDLGTDKVYQYQIDITKKEVLRPVDSPFLKVKSGGGPRHLTFHPNGNYAYLVLELIGSVMALDYQDGKLKEKQIISMVTPDFNGRLSGADIHVSPDGNFLYASNRGGANEISIFSIDATGKLELADRQSTLGKTPRNFVIDPTGKFLLAANQDTNEVIIFNRDQKTGLLTPTGQKIKVEKPVCLKFVAIEN